ncbi:hypothetical protein KKE26_06200 [bacterium]|nr:hypothetical protein [bacterium]
MWIIASSLVSQVAIATRRGITSGRERTTKGVNIGGVLKISLSLYFSIPLSPRETGVIVNEKSLARVVSLMIYTLCGSFSVFAYYCYAFAA